MLCPRSPWEKHNNVVSKSWSVVIRSWFMLTFEGKQTYFAWFWSIHFESKAKTGPKKFFLTFSFLFISWKQSPKWCKVFGAREKVLVTLATVWVVISSPGLDSLGSGFNELRPRNPWAQTISPLKPEKMASQNQNIHLHFKVTSPSLFVLKLSMNVAYVSNYTPGIFNLQQSNTLSKKKVLFTAITVISASLHVSSAHCAPWNELKR